MATKSDWLENAVINHFLRNSAQSAVSPFVALFTSSPIDAGGGVEVSGGSYARTAVTFGAPVNGVTSNSADVIFADATAPWGTVIAFGIFDASSGGNMLYYADLTESKAISTNDSVKFPSGSLTITEL